MTVSRALQSQIHEVATALQASAAGVDDARSLSTQHFNDLAAAGLYGAFAPTAVGGLELDLRDLCEIIEELASACLATTLYGSSISDCWRLSWTAKTPEHIRELLPRAVSGELKGGVALGGLLPGPPRLRATESSDGWRLDGEAPWVSGWGIVDVLFVTARRQMTWSSVLSLTPSIKPDSR